MKNIIKRWLAITSEDIIAEECSCCDDVVTQADVNIQLVEMIEDLKPKKKLKVKSE